MQQLGEVFLPVAADDFHQVVRSADRVPRRLSTSRPLEAAFLGRQVLTT